MTLVAEGNNCEFWNYVRVIGGNGYFLLKVDLKRVTYDFEPPQLEFLRQSYDFSKISEKYASFLIPY